MNYSASDSAASSDKSRKIKDRCCGAIALWPRILRAGRRRKKNVGRDRSLGETRDNGDDVGRGTLKKEHTGAGKQKEGLKIKRTEAGAANKGPKAMIRSFRVDRVITGLTPERSASFSSLLSILSSAAGSLDLVQNERANERKRKREKYIYIYISSGREKKNYDGR